MSASVPPLLPFDQWADYTGNEWRIIPPPLWTFKAVFVPGWEEGIELVGVPPLLWAERVFEHMIIIVRGVAGYQAEFLAADYKVLRWAWPGADRSRINPHGQEALGWCLATAAAAVRTLKRQARATRRRRPADDADAWLRRRLDQLDPGAAG